MRVKQHKIKISFAILGAVLILVLAGPLDQILPSIDLPLGWGVDTIKQNACSRKSFGSAPMQNCEYGFCDTTSSVGLPFANKRASSRLSCATQANDLALAMNIIVGTGLGLAYGMRVVDKKVVKKRNYRPRARKVSHARRKVSASS